MDAEIVLDASIAAKVLFTEDGSEEARELVGSGVVLIAPDLIFLEIASVAAKRLKRGETSRQQGADAVGTLPDLIDEVVASSDLVDRAFALAADHGFSAYDAAYLALAEQRGLRLATADNKLVGRARQAGFGELIRS